MAMFRKCQSKHLVDRLNPQPALRSGRITAGYPVTRAQLPKGADQLRCQARAIKLRHLQTRVLTVAKAASGREFLHRSFPAAYSRINGLRVANLDGLEPTRLEGTGSRLVASG